MVDKFMCNVLYVLLIILVILVVSSIIRNIQNIQYRRKRYEHFSMSKSLMAYADKLAHSAGYVTKEAVDLTEKASKHIEDITDPNSKVMKVLNSLPDSTPHKKEALALLTAAHTGATEVNKGINKIKKKEKTIEKDKKNLKEDAKNLKENAKQVKK